MKETVFGISTVGVAIFALIAIFVFLSNNVPGLLAVIVKILVVLAPLWAPAILTFIFWKVWVRYRRAYFIRNQKMAVIEVRIPREINRTPLAMEAVFAGLHIGIGETTFLDRNFLGKVRTWFSLELVSIDGEVHFFIYTRNFLKELLKTQIYAQYPEVEIYDVDDYTKFIPFDLDKYAYWGCDFMLGKEDAYPIRTYIDYGLDKAPLKDEEQTDPLATVMELLGSLEKGHQMWLQIIVQTHKGTKKWPWSSRYSWKNQAAELIKKIMSDAAKRTGEITGASDDKLVERITLTEGERDTIKAIERSISKQGYDCGIRGIYLAEKDKFNPIYLVGMLGVWKQFNTANLNEFSVTRYLADFNYPWQDFRNILQNRARRKIYEAYRMRSWFHEPHKTKAYVFNTEELATIYHFPGIAIKTPTISRVPSRRGEAPSNLPI